MATQREWLQLVVESSYGTKKAFPTPGTDSIYCVLPESNSFTAIAVPDIVETPFGGGFDVPVEAQADSHTVVGRLSTFIYPSQAAFLLKWALQRINTGQTTPYVTTEPPGDLASLTAYHGVPRHDGTVQRKKYPGGKCEGLELSCSRQDPRLKATFDVVFQKEVGHAADSSSDPDSSEAPEPAETDYPAGGPYLFSHTAGALLWNAVALAQYESLSLSVKNVLDPRKWETKWLASCSCNGRKSTLSADLRFKATPNLRADFQAVTARSLAVTWNNGANTLTVGYSGKNHLSQLPFDLPLGREFVHKAQWSNRWDRATSTDVTVATT